MLLQTDVKTDIDTIFVFSLGFSYSQKKGIHVCMCGEMIQVTQFYEFTLFVKSNEDKAAGIK